jgi:hypothetical protein
MASLWVYKACFLPLLQAPSTEELKALEREHNRQAQLDAERRKQKKQQEREKKRQRTLQVRQGSRLGDGCWGGEEGCCGTVLGSGSGGMGWRPPCR